MCLLMVIFLSKFSLTNISVQSVVKSETKSVSVKTNLSVVISSPYCISRPIYVIGDSRARLIYRSIVARITGQETLEDVKVHEDMSSDIVTPVKYFWSQSFDGEWEQVSHHKKMMTNAESG